MKVRELLLEFFSEFNFTTENHVVMQKVLQSDFSDLEDALQYYSAVDSNIKVIVSKNKKDFTTAKGIAVFHPQEFVESYYNN